jgi:hypothetical protein
MRCDSILLFGSLLLSTVTATAQVAVTLGAATPIAAVASPQGGTSSLQGIPQGQAIGASPNQAFLSTSQTVGSSYVSATTICYPTLATAAGAGFNFFERATARGSAQDVAGSSSSVLASAATFGPHAVLATFSVAPSTVGRVVVSFRRSAPNGGVASARIDIGNDGTSEFAQTTAAEWSQSVTIGASGLLPVLVANECQSSGNGTTNSVYTWTELYVSFQPDRTASCTFTAYGQGCASAQLAGTQLVVGASRTVLMLGTGCFPQSPVLVAIGAQQAGLALPAGCSLLSSADSLQLALADGSGAATTSWTFPTTVVGTTYVQFLPLADQNGQLVLRASNGVSIDCVR